MSVFKILLYAFLIYLGYKIIFEFIIPVYRTTRQVKKQFREMNERMNEHMKQQGEQFSPKKDPQTTKEKPGDYIEFEEVK
jgi:Sec-independent protein translocase protein TatA